MKTVFSERRRLQAGRPELIDGRRLPRFEKPEGVELILERVREIGLGEVIAPEDQGLEPIRRVYVEACLVFLETAGEQWVAAHEARDAMPLCWPTRSLRPIGPESIDGELSHFSFGAGTPITADTRLAARSAADVALTVVDLIAVGPERAVLAPRSEALEDACQQIWDYQPDALVVSLGFDTFEDDPIACFGLESDAFPAAGARIARLGLPTLFVMEGGYGIAALGVNAVNVLSGLEQAT
jgi:acetoin utilization deacetylase AcuC-like enzyme